MELERTSHTSTDEYLKCPYAWWLKRVKKVGQVHLLAGPAGSAFHTMTEDFDNGIEVKDYEDYLIAEMEDEVPYVSIRDEGYNWWVTHGGLMFRQFIKWREFTKWEVVAVEEEINVQPDPLTVPFVGRVDRRYRLSDGRIALVDIKTGYRMPTRSPQLGEYQAASIILGRQVDTTAYYDARAGKTTGLEVLPEWTPEKLVSHVLPVETGILNDEFPPKPSAQNCRFCYVKAHCEFRAGS